MNTCAGLKAIATVLNLAGLAVMAFWLLMLVGDSSGAGTIMMVAAMFGAPFFAVAWIINKFAGG